MFFSLSFDSLLSRGSLDTFTGSLARSGQELWLIKCLWPARAFNIFPMLFYYKVVANELQN